MHRVSKDIISSNPDVVFIDYAVNDCSMPSSEQAGETMENIIRQLMKLDHQPMIILAHMPTKSQGELTKTIPTFNALAEKYGIGYINVAQYIADEVTAGTYTWDTTDTTKTVISGDGVHPNSNGAAAYGAYIVEQLTNSPASYFKKMTELADAQYSALNFNAPKLVAHTAGQYTGWWTESTSCNNRLQANVAMAQKNGDSVTYKFVGSAIGLYMVKNPTGATASYSIDDGAVTGTVDASLGLSMPQYERLAAGLDYGVHTVTITLTEDGSFGIGYFCED